jgi:hypothetical protein
MTCGHDLKWWDRTASRCGHPDHDASLFDPEDYEDILKPWQGGHADDFPPRRADPLHGTPPTAGPSDSIQKKFEQYHTLNPDVYVAFCKLARDYQGRGYPSIGIGHLTEILRFERRLDTYDPVSEFKISNSYRSRYSRFIMSQEADLDGFFTTRDLRTE